MPDIKATRKAGWQKIWTADHIKSVWDEKIAQAAWLSTPAYKMITDACEDYESVLDVGCGGGIQYAAFREYAPEIKYTGIDIHPGMVKYARQAFPEVTFDEGDATELPYADNEFDAAMLRLVIVHYKPDFVEQILAEAIRVSSKALIILFGAPPVDMVDAVRLGREGNADFNIYGREWLKSKIGRYSSQWKFTKFTLEETYIYKKAVSTAEGNQELWVVRYDV